MAIGRATTEALELVGDPTFRKLAAALDMFLCKFPFHEWGCLRIATLPSRYKDCSAFTVIGQFEESTKRDLGYLARFIWSEKVADDLDRIMKRGQEINQDDSYIKYMSDMELVRRSPYSYNVNINLHNWVHCFGTFLGIERHMNAIFISEVGFREGAMHGSVAAFYGAMGTGSGLVYAGKTKQAKRYQDLKSAALSMNDNRGMPVNQRRLGTRLRIIKKTTTENVVVKTTGKNRKKSLLAGKDKLTDKVIGKLTKYFGKAIRDNVGKKTTDDMRRDALSGYYHNSSTDKFPRHDQCPPGEKSWCFYNRETAMNMKTSPHSEMKIYFRLDEAERKLVLGVYLDLTREELLQKCLKGRTQNANESFHSKIWSRIPKTKFASLPRLKYSINFSVMNHNVGYVKGFKRSDLGSVSTYISKRKLEALDKERLRKSLTPRGPKRRKIIHDDDDYEPGGF